MIRAVVFDMDGLLIDTEQHLHACWGQAIREAGFPAERDALLGIRSLAREFAVPYFREKFGPEADCDSLWARRRELMEERIARFGIHKKAGLDELLDYLEANGYKKAVATATGPEKTEDYLTRIGVYHRFDRVVCATTVPHGKPMPDVYLYACGQIGERPEDCLALEDSDNGALAAHRAGCPVVMVPDLAGPLPETEAFLTGVASDLSKVIPILEGLR
ncbi:MAG: HAD family phosphatase [Eubacteriales bacterium]|nr:HAD family phosphatase [Eubacteriales bacterium]